MYIQFTLQYSLKQIIILLSANCLLERFLFVKFKKIKMKLQEIFVHIFVVIVYNFLNTFQRIGLVQCRRKDHPCQGEGACSNKIGNYCTSWILWKNCPKVPPYLYSMLRLRPVDTGGQGGNAPPIICQTCLWRCYKRSLIWQQFWQQFILAIHAPPIPVQLSMGLRLKYFWQAS